MTRAWCFVLLAGFAAAQTNGRVEGHVVTPTGEPVRKATVRLQGPQAQGANQVATFVEVTGADGSFAFADLPPGRYTAIAEKTGFAAARVTRPIQLSAGQVERDLTVKMTPLAVISGRVLDEDGDALASARLTLLNYRWDGATRVLQRTATGMADDRGEFRLANLAPGRYFVMAEDSMAQRMAQQATRIGASAQIVPVPTYYPGDTDVRRALSVEAKSGQEVQGLVIRMRRAQTFSIKGRAVSGVTNEPLAGTVRVMDADDATQIRGTASVRGSGDSFQVRGLPAGVYTMVFNANVNPSARDQGLTGVLDITVSGDLDNVLIRANPNLQVTGRITVEDGDFEALLAPMLQAQNQLQQATRLAAARVNGGVGAVPATTAAPVRSLPIGLITTGSQQRSSHRGQMVDDGTFTIANIPPGQYALTLPNIGGTYVKTVRAGGSDIMGAPLDLTQNAPGPIEIVLAKDVGQLTIAPLAEAKDAQTVRQIVLWPKQPLGLLQTSGVVALSLGGQAKVAPGDFYLAAFEDADTASVRAYGFLALFNDLATEVTLKVGEPVTGEAAVISHEAMEAVLASLP